MRFSQKNSSFFIIFPRHPIFPKIPPKTLDTGQNCGILCIVEILFLVASAFLGNREIGV